MVLTYEKVVTYPKRPGRCIWERDQGSVGAYSRRHLYAQAEQIHTEGIDSRRTT
jgi:hypothetical protein